MSRLSLLRLTLTHPSTLHATPSATHPQNGDIKEVMEKADKMAAEIAGK